MAADANFGAPMPPPYAIRSIITGRWRRPPDAPAQLAEAGETNNPSLRDLLKAANDASSGGRNAWLAFIGLMAYLVVTLAGVTHKDLLLNEATNLPFVNVKIPLTGFFGFAPIVLLFFHFGLLVQHGMLHEKLRDFAEKLQADAPEDAARHPIKSELHSYFFTQGYVGKPQTWYMRNAFIAMKVVTFILAPFFIFFYFQTKFLPFHNEPLTWAHRIFLLLDIMALWMVGAFMFRHRRLDEAEPEKALWRKAMRIPRWFGVTRSFIAAVFLTSVFVASVPDGNIDSFMRDKSGWTRSVPITCGATTSALAGDRQAFTPTAWLFERKETSKSLFTLSLCNASIWLGGSRNLDVADIDFVKDKDLKDVPHNETTINLRNRHLQYADFSRSDLKQADFHAAKLHGAKFQESDLKQAKFRDAQAQGANLVLARLQGANLVGAKLQGANLVGTRLQGADISGARLQGADISGARLQGANLRGARLQGADLLGASLQGANLGGARLQGADLLGARLQGANLGGARIWFTPPMTEKYTNLTAFKPLEIGALAPLEQKVIKTENANLEQLAAEMAKFKSPGAERVASALQTITKVTEPLIDESKRSDAEIATWAKNRKIWEKFAARDLPGSDKLACFLAELACSDETEKAYLAKGLISARFFPPPNIIFGLSRNRTKPVAPSIFYGRFKSCPAAKKIPASVMERLKKAAEKAAAQAAKAPAKPAQSTAIQTTQCS